MTLKLKVQCNVISFNNKNIVGHDYISIDLEIEWQICLQNKTIYIFISNLTKRTLNMICDLIIKKNKFKRPWSYQWSRGMGISHPKRTCSSRSGGADTYRGESRGVSPIRVPRDSFPRLWSHGARWIWLSHGAI